MNQLEQEIINQNRIMCIKRQGDVENFDEHKDASEIVELLEKLEGL